MVSFPGVLCVSGVLGDVHGAAVLSNTREDCWVAVLRNAIVGRVGELGEGVRVSVVPWFGYRRGRR